MKKLYKSKPVKADEIRYAGPNGKQRVVNVDNYDFRYLIKEIEDNMGYEFASQVEDLLSAYNTDMSYQSDTFLEIVDEYTGVILDDRQNAMDAVYKLLDIVNEWNASATGEDKKKLDTIRDIILFDLDPAVSVIEGDVHDLKDQLGLR